MSKVNFGLESIRRQNNEFLEALVSCVSRLKTAGTFDDKAVKNSFLVQTIKQFTGLNVVVILSPGWRASIRPPQLLPDSVFYGSRVGQSVGTTILDIKNTTLKGTVDIENVKVSGIFSEVKSELMLGEALFNPTLVTTEEAVAIILHELGHAFTYFQFISTIAVGALVINKTINNIFLTDNYQTKEIHLKAGLDTLGIDSDFDDSNVPVNTSKENLEVILVSRFMRGLLTRSTTSYYDMRNCEQLADTFATKHGAGIYLARINHKMDLHLGEYGNKNFFVHILAETSKLISVFARSPYSFREILLTMAQPKQYDDPKDRITFIKFQLIDDLKQLPKGAKESRANILQSIEEIDLILKDINPRRDVLRYIHDTFTASGRSARAQEKSQKVLEEMLFNNLFYQSAKIKSMYQE